MADFDARMDLLRARFVAQAAAERVQLTTDREAGRWDAVRSTCHGLAGRAGMFGFAALGDCARAVEEGIDEGLRRARLDPLIDRLLAELARLPAT